MPRGRSPYEKIEARHDNPKTSNKDANKIARTALAERKRVREARKGKNENEDLSVLSRRLKAKTGKRPPLTVEKNIAALKARIMGLKEEKSNFSTEIRKGRQSTNVENRAKKLREIKAKLASSMKTLTELERKTAKRPMPRPKR